MLTLMFWNIRCNNIPELVADVAHDNNVDIVILAENKISLHSLLTPLNSGQRSLYTKPREYKDRLQFFTRFPSSSLRCLEEIPGVSIRILTTPLGNDIIIAAAHLSSKLYDNDDEQDSEAERIAQSIIKQEEKIGHTRTIVIGDLNMNPFQNGMVKARGFHAVMDRRVAKRGSRIVKEVSYPLFYNPMWSHFGDPDRTPPGTYYCSDSSHICHFWYMFDQVLLRPALLEYFKPENLKIISSIGSKSLAKTDGTPDSKIASDHFPLIISLDI